nr:hypothetical protein [Tanacetum cinerariifolium]
MSGPDDHLMVFVGTMDVQKLSELINQKARILELRWQMAILTMRAKRFLQKTGKNLGANGPTSMGFDMSKVKCYNCHRKGHFAWECRSPKDSRRNSAAEPQRRTIPFENSTSNALVSQCDRVPSCSKACSKAYAQLHSQCDKLTDDFRKFQFDVISYQTESDCESCPPTSLYDRFQPSDGYHVIPPSYTGTFMTPKPDLVFNTAPSAVKTDHSAFTVQLSPTKLAQDLSHTNRPTAPIIEDWVSDSKDESKTKAPQIVPSFVQSFEQVKSPRHSVQHVETTIPATTPKSASLKPASSGKRRNRKACFVCKSVDHLIKDCDYHAKKMAQPTPRNHAHRGNHKQNAPLTHTNPQKYMVPDIVLTQSNSVYITAVRPVSADVPKFRVTQPRHAKPFVTKSKSSIRRHLTRSYSPKTSNSPPRVTAIKAPVVSAAQGNPQHALKDKGVIDSGCSRHIIGNMSYLSDFEELNGGYVALEVTQRVVRFLAKEKLRQ